MQEREPPVEFDAGRAAAGWDAGERKSRAVAACISGEPCQDSASVSRAGEREVEDGVVRSTAWVEHGRRREPGCGRGAFHGRPAVAGSCRGGAWAAEKGSCRVGAWSEKKYGCGGVRVE